MMYPENMELKLFTSTLCSIMLLFHLSNAASDIISCVHEDLRPAFQPRQIHLSSGYHESDVFVVWQTAEPTPTSAVKYFWGPCSNSDDYRIWNVVFGSSKKYSDDGGIVHQSTIQNLKVDSAYCYVVGDPCKGWSDEFEFKTPSPKKVSFAALADTGTWGNVTHVLARLAADKDSSLVVHAGDLSYGLNANVWDTWGDLVEPVASTRPYLIIPGNWDVKPDAISHFLNRYSMPRTIPSTETKPSYYYSVNHALVHIVMMSSYDDYEEGSEQYAWLERDLRAASKDREKHPWIVVCFHSPMYSSSTGHGGGDEKFRAAIEHMLRKYSVDLAITGHDHGYERTYPVYNKIPDTKQKKHYYSNTPATIHILAGTGGATTDPWLPVPPWTAHRESSYGYTKVTATQAYMHVEYVRGMDGSIGDEFWISKGSGDTPFYFIVGLAVILLVIFPVLVYKGLFSKVFAKHVVVESLLPHHTTPTPAHVNKHR